MKKYVWLIGLSWLLIHPWINSEAHSARIKSSTQCHEVYIRSLDPYLHTFRGLESSHNWKAINEYGYIGYYQFGALALADVNETVSYRKFRKNPHTFLPSRQHGAMKRLLALNAHRLKDIIQAYHGRKFQGLQISSGGILAAAHLLGAHAVRQWFANPNRVFEDANGTTIQKYLYLFRHYHPHL